MAGIVDARQLLRGFPYAMLACFVASAILTPPDWVSQVFLALPMSVLYLAGVGVAWLFGGARTKESEEKALASPSEAQQTR